MPNKKVSDLAVSWETLIELFATATTEAELEESGKRHANDLLFAPPDSQDYRDFIIGCDYFGE